uniref:Uncharacterized protein n=1 Tax=Anguilla anguilla TaxID=7936 RepID=A0A0E9WFV3_ANGAN
MENKMHLVLVLTSYLCERCNNTHSLGVVRFFFSLHVVT